ncbi:hypothetical protein Lalb_Chr23g0272881 [Lupinus albus]|uniref:Uncharacterized protein n=1 Tax=Lupinus albus TaxID=3870 RepID=A0A6A4NLE2_LUPAL|nr:hypothetical protein Lalb_Chr23g0272881 [Lupinus albus]
MKCNGNISLPPPSSPLPSPFLFLSLFLFPSFFLFFFFFFPSFSSLFLLCRCLLPSSFFSF